MTTLRGQYLAITALCLLLLLALTPAAFADAPDVGDRIFNGRTGAPVAVAAAASPAAVITVSSDTAGWDINNCYWDGATYQCGAGATPSGTHGAFTNGPIPTSGSLHQVVGTDGDDGTRLRTTVLNGMLLADITELSYSTYVTNFVGGQATYMQLSVDWDNDGDWDDTLYFEPVYQTGTYGGDPVPDQCPGIYNCVSLNAWQTWDAKNGGWWTYNAGTWGPPVTTLASYIAAHPGAKLITTDPGLRLTAGFGAGAWDNFDGYVDNLTVNGDTYDFELIVNTAWVDDDYTSATSGWGVDHFATIQAGIDAVAANGTVNVYPGTYSETASGRYLYDASGPYQFGLFFADEKGAVTLQGIKADGTPITNAADVAATINTNATNNYGPSGFWVEGDGVTIAGIRIGTNSAGQNKTVEVIGDNFTLKNCDVADVSGSIYLNDWRFDDINDVSYVKAYRIEGNTFASGVSLDIASGPGVSGPVSARVITGNTFASASGDNWPPISFSGADTGVPWFEFSVGGAVITGNTFTNDDPTGQLIRARGTYEEAQFDWASYWNDNTFDKAVIVTTNGDPAHPRTYSYPNSYGTFNNVRRIGAIVQGEVDHAVAGDTILVAAGTYVESGQIVIAKDLTIVGADRATTILKPAGDTGSSGDARGWFLVNSGVEFNLSKLTLDGQGRSLQMGILTYGTGTIDNVAFSNISAGTYVGRGMSVYAPADVTVKNSTFTNIGRIGVFVFGAGAKVTVEDSTYTGKGAVDGLDYALEAGGGGSLIATGNTITGCTAVASTDGSGSAGILATTYFGPGTTATIENNVITGNTLAVGVGYDASDTSVVTIHENDLSGNTFGVETTAPSVNAENNWWGSACGPAAGYVSVNVDYDPWWTDATGGGTASGDGVGGLTIPAGATTAAQQAVLDCAAPGSTVTFAANGAAYAGGLQVNTNALTLKLNGNTFGPGSPWLTVNADDVTVIGPGVIDGGGAAFPAVAVLAGADNFTLKNAEVRAWAHGVEVQGNVISFKLVDNFIHSNAGAGLHVNTGVTIGGIINVYGNLFKVNTGPGILNEGLNAPLVAQYNSWGHIAGPASGDGVSANVDTANFTYLEYFMDVDPDNLALTRQVAEGASFDVMLKADARKVNGIAFNLTYNNTLLQLNNATYEGIWAAAGAFCLTPDTATPGVVAGTCSLQTSEWDGDAAPIMKLNFTVLPLTASPLPSALDILHGDAVTNAGAYGGAKVYVNNAGYGLASVPDRDITDTNDGELVLGILANYTGFVDLQGRTDESGAFLKAYDSATKTTSVLLAKGQSAAGGVYTTAHEPGKLMFKGATYWIVLDRALYLPTTVMATSYLYPGPVPLTWTHSKNLLTAPTTPVATLVLLGGDATDNDVVDINDASCMGSSYNSTSICANPTPGTAANADVNGDGFINILDLSLMGGNYYKVTSVAPSTIWP